MTMTKETYEKLADDRPDGDSQLGTSGHEATAPQPTAVLPSSSAKKPREQHKNNLYGLGIAECVLGGLSMVLGIVTLSVRNSSGSPHALFHFHYLLTYTSQGLWAGLFIAVTGILGICAKNNPSVSIYKANMTLSIITAAISGIAIVLSGLAVATSIVGSTHLALHTVITLLLSGGFIIAIIHSAFCCAGICNRQSSHPGTVVYIPQVPPSQQIGGLPSVQYVVPAGTAMTQYSNNASPPMGCYPVAVVASPPPMGQQQVFNVNAPVKELVPTSSENPCTSSSVSSEMPSVYTTVPRQ